MRSTIETRMVAVVTGAVLEANTICAKDVNEVVIALRAGDAKQVQVVCASRKQTALTQKNRPKGLLLHSISLASLGN